MNNNRRIKLSQADKVALTSDDHSPALDLLRLIIHGGMFNNKIRAASNEEGIDTWYDRYKRILSENISTVTKDFIKQLPKLLEDNKVHDIKN